MARLVPATARRDETRRQICVCDWGVMEDESRVLEAVTAALCSLGDDVNAVNNAGDTALHCAAAMRYDSVVQLLAEKGADRQRQEQARTDAVGTAISGGGRRGRATADGEAGPDSSGASEHGGAAA